VETATGRPPVAPRPDWRVVAPALALLLGGAAYLSGWFDLRQAGLYLIGGALGLVLYHAAFGFASSWRAFLFDRRGAGLRAQMLMLAVASLIFLPVLAEGTLFGQSVGGAVAPVGVSVMVGAFLFGIGMQLGGGCASGTLYTVGGGSTNMVVTLLFFMVGSLIGSAHLPWWLEQPSLGSVSMLKSLGLGGALALQFALFAAIAGLAAFAEMRRHGHIDHGFAMPLPARAPRPRLLARALSGPWPILWGAVLLALLNGVTLGVAGHPWTVSFGYTLWGAKAAAALGIDVASWEFWTWPYPQRALQGGLLGETTSLMNFGILVGAFLAAGLAGRFAPRRRVALRIAAAAAIGGLLMGYGARLAFGCNIGAFFSGVASGSVHGWVWFVFGMAGTAIGGLLRPRFGLAVEGRLGRRSGHGGR
jgi:uncharacterized membrane protein YedE/YeeE